MQKSKIEWCDYSVNPVKGLCPMACPYCYARRMYKRFKWNPEVRFEPIRDADLPKKPSRIFVGSTMELFGEWVDAFWLDSIFRTVKDNPQHTFIFLTKQPQNLAKWSPFPDNCWVGVSAPNAGDAVRANKYMAKVRAKVKFISIEPMGYWNLFTETLIGILSYYQWVIIGQQTPVKDSTKPKSEWIQEIIEASQKANIPIFIKNNILDDWNSHWLGRWNRQEFPND